MVDGAGDRGVDGARAAPWALAFGGFMAMYLAAIGVGDAGEVTVTDFALLVAVLAVVPAAAVLHPHAPARVERWLVLAALPAGAALLMPRGLLAAVLGLPWLLVVTAGAVRALVGWLRGSDPVGRRGSEQWLALPWAAAAVYLVVGAVWLVVDRAGGSLAGVRQPIVQLTAVHFHFSGFVTTVLGASALRRLPHDRALRVAAFAIVAAHPVTAIGFLASGALQIAGAVILTLGILVLAWRTLRSVVPAASGRARLLLAASSLAVVAPMLLAVHWAAGTVLGFPTLSIPVMALTHGLVNALGFAACGVAGWRLLEAPPR